MNPTNYNFHMQHLNLRNPHGIKNKKETIFRGDSLTNCISSQSTLASTIKIKILQADHQNSKPETRSQGIDQTAESYLLAAVSEGTPIHQSILHTASPGIRSRLAAPRFTAMDRENGRGKESKFIGTEAKP